MNINKYEIKWNSIVEYAPAVVATSLWDIFDEIFAGYYTNDSIKRRIVSRCAPFCPLYGADSEEDLEYWFYQLRVWGDMHKIEWKRAWDAFNAEYGPIDNYNRHEETTTTYDLEHPDNTTVTTFVAPETTDTFYNTGKSTTEGGIEQNGTVGVVSDVTGNVGVTTSQQMIQSELDLRAQSFIERYVINPFVKEFAVAVY